MTRVELRPMVRRAAGPTLLAAVLGLASALQLEIDPSGGPLVLEERVAEALAAWAAAGVDVDAVDRRVAVRYADADLLGPDVPVLVRVAAGGGVELLVHPQLLDEVPAGLTEAIGLALGAPPPPGAGARLVAPGAEFVPDVEAAAAIEEARAVDPADLDQDGVVDFEDLLILAERFGQRGLNLVGDLNADGVIDERDLELLRERYTFTPPSRTPPAAPAAPDTPAPGAPPGLPELPGAPIDDDEDDGASDDDADMEDEEGGDEGEPAGS